MLFRNRTRATSDLSNVFKLSVPFQTIRIIFNLQTPPLSRKLRNTFKFTHPFYSITSNLNALKLSPIMELQLKFNSTFSHTETLGITFRQQLQINLHYLPLSVPAPPATFQYLKPRGQGVRKQRPTRRARRIGFSRTGIPVYLSRSLKRSSRLPLVLAFSSVDLTAVTHTGPAVCISSRSL